MKNKIKDIIILCIVSGVISVIGTLGVYYLFPQYLCYAIYDVHASDLHGKEEKPVAGGEYVETFIPTSPYLKNIAISVTTEKSDEIYEEYVVGKLTDASGKVIARDSCELSAGMSLEYCEFTVEKWVTPGEEYQLWLDFPEREDVLVTFCVTDAGPAEHVSLTGGLSDKENMYMRYTYGTYSKKLLAIWAVAFFVGAYFLIEEVKKSGRSA